MGDSPVGWQTAVVQGWIGVIGALAGGSIAILGQYGFRLAERRDEQTALFLEQCAQLIALTEDYHNRVWEERHLGLQERVAEWKLGDYRLAEARVRILCRDPRLLDALDQLGSAGKALGKAWRATQEDNEGVETAWHQHREAINRFVAASAAAIDRKRINRIRRAPQSL